MKLLDPMQIGLTGTRLIEASAGTGKTHTITSLVLRQLIERGIEVGRILVVTYTRAATAELRDRIRQRLREALHAFEAASDGAVPGADAARDDVIRTLVERSRASGSLERGRTRVRAALRGFDEAAIFTIHGLCQRVLQDHAFESGVSFESELAGRSDSLLAELAADFWARSLHAAPEIVVRFVSEPTLCRHVFTPERLALLARRVATQPDLPVLPERCGKSDLGVLEQRWSDALLDLARIWACDRDEVIGLLCDGDDLNRSTYKVDKIRSNWVPILDEVLAAGEPGISRRNEFFPNLTQQGILARTNKGRAAPVHAFFSACERFLACEGELLGALDARVLDLELEFTDYAREELARRRRATGVQSFDDLLQDLVAALRGERGEVLAAGVRARFPVALVDEFQDTDPVQYEIFRRIWHEQADGLFLIGDPKQAIYAFRGADVFAYMKARRDSGGESFGLTVNRRAGPGLVRALDCIFSRARAPFVFDEIPFQPVLPVPGAQDLLQDGRSGTAPFEILFLGRGAPAAGGRKATVRDKQWARDAVSRAIAADISRLLSADARIDGRAVEAGDVAVLCRTNRQAEQIQVELRDLGIPGVVQTDASVFASEEAEELGRLLEALAEPGNVVALKAALATRLLGLVADDLFALDEGDDAWDDWIGRFHAWHENWQDKGSLAALRRVLDELEVPARLLALADGERRLTNLLHLAELLQGALVPSTSGPLGLLEWLRRMRCDAIATGELAGDEALIRLESDARAVQITTVHRSKGLEYPIVYCPFLWEGRLLHKDDKQWVRFHDPEDDGRLKLDLGSDRQSERVCLVEREALAESLRLLYVALTRARHRTLVVWGAIKEAGNSPLAYLLHQPPNAGGEGAVDSEELAARVQERYAQLSDAELRADLEALVQSADGTLALRDLDLSPGLRRAPEKLRSAALRARSSHRSLSPTWRTSSFSGLVAAEAGARGGARAARSLPAASADPADEGRDYDARGPIDPSLGEAAWPDAERVRLHDFPAGAGPGTLLHAIFERIDFAAADPEDLQQVVADSLARHGVAERWLAPLCESVAEIVSTPLPASQGSFALAQVVRSARIDELEFVLPVQAAAERGLVTPARLAEVFERHAGGPVVRAYAERLRELDFLPLEGHLRGYIDLVFEYKGRFHVVDYKSNLLGPCVSDYRPVRLQEPMLGHHYVLQYHLYLVALHRHLQQRLPGYDYERDVAGAWYLFLRGMSPAYAAGNGVYHDRPPFALVQALSALFAASGPGGVHAGGASA